jgi:hypothetical protein
MSDITVTFGGREVVRYADVPDGDFFRIAVKPDMLWQKLEFCACSMDWKLLRLVDDAPCVLEQIVRSINEVLGDS